MSLDIIPLPINDEEIKWWVDYAKTMPSYSEAQYFENALRYRLIDENPKRRELLDNIRHYYFEETCEKSLKKIEERIDSKYEKKLGLPKIDLDDDQIADAVIQVQSEFKSGKDYQGIHRILVDFCGWPNQLTDFCERFAKLDFKDSLKFTCDYSAKSASKSTFYQNIQEGVSNWPNNYTNWRKSDITDKTFIQRREIATKFYEILKEKEKVF